MPEIGSSSVEREPIARLRWRCRRGMLELDVLLMRYLERCYLPSPPEERRAFAALLELQDPQLLAFVMGWEVPQDPDMKHVVARLASSDP